MNKDLTVGKPSQVLWQFCLPMFGSIIFQQLYNIADSLVAGKFIGENALAAVGNSYEITLIFLAFSFGCNIGGSVIVSRYFGAKDYNTMKTAVTTALIGTVVLCGALMAVGLLGCRSLLVLIRTPAELMADSAEYLDIYTLGLPFLFLYNVATGIFTALGDSRTPFLFLAVSSTANIAVDVLFVAVFRWGVAGSAWATALAQALSAVVAAVLLFRKYPMMRMRRQDLRLHGKLLRQITVLAIPIAVQSAFNNLGNLVAQSAVNLFGEATMAAYTAASRIGTLALMPVETIGSSLSVYASQNHGAGKPQRIRQGVRASLQLSLVVSTVLGVFLLLCGRQMAGLFLAEPSAEILTVVQRFLLITAVPGILAGVMQVYQQVLRGVDRANQALMGGVMQLITKIAVVAVGAWGMRNLDVVWLGWPASFVAGTVIPYFCFQKIVREMETE